MAAVAYECIMFAKRALEPSKQNRFDRQVIVSRISPATTDCRSTSWSAIIQIHDQATSSRRCSGSSVPTTHATFDRQITEIKARTAILRRATGC